MQRYNPKEIEPKWQKQWAESGVYQAEDDSKKPKRYILEYFPYPSGAAMHVGHVRNYTIGDALARHARMNGYDVLHPMGWDAFGLPAENYAIKTGISPQDAIQRNTARFKQQLIQMGFGYDWSREITSSNPDYYRWTQWFFLLLYKKGLAYQKESLQWWCPVDKTVLANEQVENGRCWRCGAEVEKKALRQWFFKITDYADRLAKDLDKVDWSESIKTMQRNWIGRSVGAEIDFKVENTDETLRVFSTRPDTIFGATFMVVAPEHPVLDKIVPPDHRQQLEHYRARTRAESDIQRQETNREKTGVATGAYAINPLSGERIPIWVSDYVLYNYGTGVIMGVPAHDERDFAFAEKFHLPIGPVVVPEAGKYFVAERAISEEAAAKLSDFGEVTVERESPNLGTVWRVAVPVAKEEDFRKFLETELFDDQSRGWYSESMGTSDWVVFHGQSLQLRSKADHDRYIQLGLQKGARRKDLNAALPEPWHGEGVLINSGPYTGMTTEQARQQIVKDLEAKHLGQEQINYRIHDWLISRQRYWGAPIPIIYCQKCGVVPVPEDQLPVVLPPMQSFEPSGDGRSPLARVPEFVNVTCPTCGGPAHRETDTMDGFACSSWYFLRFADPHNDQAPFSKDKADYWLPVDDYIGGAEHAVMHLLYARMWTKVMFDEGMIDFDEPFTTLRNQGMILAPDGQKISKSKGNTIEPDSLIEQGYGADAIRIMELFIGPWNQMANWSIEGMGGSFRFLQRVWTLTQDFMAAKPTGSGAKEAELHRAANRAIKSVSDDLQLLGFNTAIAALMEYVNELYKLKVDDPFASQDAWRFAVESLLQLLAPFAPHITEELWHQLGHEDSIHVSQWPRYDAKLLVADQMTIAVQVNGKVRAELTVASDADADAIIAAAQAHDRVKPHIEGKELKKTVYVPGRLVSLVV